MAETLGSLCDKLTILKLKQYHSGDDVSRQNVLSIQIWNICNEIDCYITSVMLGTIPVSAVYNQTIKIYNEDGNKVSEVVGGIADVISVLADVNCQLWHEQEKVYEFEKVPPEYKDVVVKKLALLNLKRVHCIDAIDKQFQKVMTHE